MIFGTLIKITIGFYIGCVGVVLQEHSPSVYTANISCRDADNSLYTFPKIISKNIDFVIITNEEYDKFFDRR